MGGEESLETLALFRWIFSEPYAPDVRGPKIALSIVRSATRGYVAMQLYGWC